MSAGAPSDPAPGARLPRLARTALFLLLLPLLAGEHVAAQTSGVLLAGPGDGTVERPVRFIFSMASRVRRPGGTGWVTGTVLNRDAKAQRVEILAGTNGFGQATHGARFVVALEPGASADVLLPVPYPGSGWPTLSLTADGFTDSRQLELKGDAHLGLLVVAEPERGAALGRALAEAANAALRPAFALPAEEPDVVPPSWLPPRWTLLSGFDAILLDAQVDAVQQRVLVDAVSAGARLLLTRHAVETLPAGPLQERLAPLAGPGVVEWGFGSATSLEDPEPSQPGTLSHALAEAGLRERVALDEEASARRPPAPGGTLLRASLFVMPGTSAARASGLPFDALLLPQALQTILAVPTGVFALIVLVYVAFLGWLAVRELRRRTPLRLLGLLPASGGALTVLVLGGGLVAEGLSVRGASRSLALLDQQAHEAVVVGGRTLYTGFLSPSCRPQPGTQVVPLSALADDGGPLMVNAHAGGRLDPGLLPARTPVSLALTTVGPVRERLLVRAGDDGSLRLVAEDSFRPRDSGGSVALRLPDGRGFLSDAHGVLQPVDDAALASAARALLSSFAEAPLLTRGALGESLNPLAVALPEDVQLDGKAALRDLGARLSDLTATGLPPGSYLARLEDGALLDDLGLNIDEEAGGVHLVLGRFAPGDVP